MRGAWVSVDDIKNGNGDSHVVSDVRAWVWSINLKNGMDMDIAILCVCVCVCVCVVCGAAASFYVKSRM